MDIVTELRDISLLTHDCSNAPGGVVAQLQMKYDCYRMVNKDINFISPSTFFAAAAFRLLEYLIGDGRLVDLYKSIPSADDLQTEEMRGEAAEYRGEFWKAQSELVGLLRPDARAKDNPSSILARWANQAPGSKKMPMIVLLGRFFNQWISYHIKKEMPEVKFGSELLSDYMRDKYISQDTLQQVEEVSADKASGMAEPEEIDRVIGCVLSHMFCAPVTIVIGSVNGGKSKSAYKDRVFTFPEEPNKRSPEDRSVLRLPGREYAIIMDHKACYILYERSPVTRPLLLISDMIHPMVCGVCKKVIDKFDSKSENRLFVSRSCKYKHKYHCDCLSNVLKKKCGDEIKKLISGLQDCTQPQSTCVGYGCALTIKDLKMLFPDYFKGEYLKLIDEIYSNDPFVLSAACTDKSKTKSGIKADLMINSPFKRRTQKGEKSFAMAKCSECSSSNEHPCGKEQVVALLGGPHNNCYQHFCCLCGAVMRCERKPLLRLSCGHICCVICGLTWLSFSNVDDEKFRKYVGEEKAKGVLWPVCSCYFCGGLFDLVSVLLHDSHYISLPQLLRRCFLNGEKLEKCIETGCDNPVVPQLKDLLWKITYNRTKMELNSRVLKFEEIKDYKEVVKKVEEPKKLEEAVKAEKAEEMKEVKIIPKHELIDQWLRHRYAKLDMNDDKIYLIGYNNSFAEAKEDVAKFEECVKKIQSFEDENGKFVERMSKKLTVSNSMKEIHGACDIKDTDLKSTKKRYIDARIFGEMYGYKLDEEILFMNTEGMDHSAESFGVKPDEEMCVSGPFGRGIYLSAKPSDVHGSSRAKDTVFTMAAVCILRPEKYQARPVFPCDERRVAGDLQKPKFVPEKVGGDENATIKGNMLEVTENDSKWTVVYDPTLVVPLRLISYTVELS